MESKFAYCQHHILASYNINPSGPLFGIRNLGPTICFYVLYPAINIRLRSHYHYCCREISTEKRQTKFLSLKNNSNFLLSIQHIRISSLGVFLGQSAVASFPLRAATIKYLLHRFHQIYMCSVVSFDSFEIYDVLLADSILCMTHDGSGSM